MYFNLIILEMQLIYDIPTIYVILYYYFIYFIYSFYVYIN